jgi:hypothetical protein
MGCCDVTTMKKRWFAIGLATQFLSCIRHLPLIVFIHYECYWTIARVATHRIYGATHYNLIATLLQLLFNYYATPI